MSKKQSSNKKYADFLDTFFTEKRYTEREVNGFWLVKHWDGSLKKFVIYLYTQESFKAYKDAGKKYAQNEEEMDRLNNLSWIK